ncbi:MAG TPA: IPTL-CTERM sorting domain-containing protein [Thermoanaerobaculia bacterium]|jgi:parallel beta-helix repeat protein|nr:IPTL-CTERM sorting domain-containing protein [Thermoanaerobaculia bacterium]
MVSFLRYAVLRSLYLLLALGAIWDSTPGATAATFTVMNLAEAGPGSLRQAVLDANATAGDDEVAFAPGLTGMITLTSDEILITDSLVVSGPGAGVLTVSGNDHSRIFHVENSGLAAPIDVTLSRLTLTLGNSLRSQGDVAGGAVFVSGENLTILDSVITSSTSGVPFDPEVPGCGGNVGSFGLNVGTLRIANSTLTGGRSVGISGSNGGNLCVNGGRLILEESTLSGGTAHLGGGLYAEAGAASSEILQSTISGNQAFDYGGGIYLSGASFTIESSTISGNTAGVPDSNPALGLGGGLYLTGGNLQILNGTVSSNRAGQTGGGIAISNTSLLLRLTTVSNNTAGIRAGSIMVSEPTNQVQLDHAIVANGVPQDLASRQFAIFPPTLTANYSLIEAPGDSVLVGAHNLVGADPLLGPLAGNGGPTLTHRPLPGSPVIDAGNPAIPSPPPTDQLGFARIFGPAVDLGSVEVGQELMGVPALSPAGLLVLAALLFALSVRRLRRERPE